MKHSSFFNAKIFLATSLFLLLTMPPQQAFSQEAIGEGGANGAQALFGIWENSTRFVEIAADGRMRVILKPYYTFVYEAEGYISASVAQERAFEEGGIYTLLVSYPGQRAQQTIPAAVVDGNALYTGFYIKEENGSRPPASGDATMLDALSGFWIYRGGEGGLRIYGTPPADEFYCLYFDGARYYRIRYWLTDARFRPVNATFLPAGAEKELSVPKFLQSGNLLYTCVKSTGTRLRNYESGTWEYSDGAISFFADKIVFAGKNMVESAALTLAGDGSCLLLGEPQFALSSVSDMDAEIAEHNAHRRPQRRPPLDFMDLDFGWEEIERLR